MAYRTNKNNNRNKPNRRHRRTGQMIYLANFKILTKLLDSESEMLALGVVRRYTKVDEMHPKQGYYIESVRYLKHIPIDSIRNLWIYKKSNFAEIKIKNRVEEMVAEEVGAIT